MSLNSCNTVSIASLSDFPNKFPRNKKFLFCKIIIYILFFSLTNFLMGYSKMIKIVRISYSTLRLKDKGTQDKAYQGNSKFSHIP